jgi:hypothetical protein
VRILGLVAAAACLVAAACGGGAGADTTPPTAEPSGTRAATATAPATTSTGSPAASATPSASAEAGATSTTAAAPTATRTSVPPAATQPPPTAAPPPPTATPPPAPQLYTISAAGEGWGPSPGTIPAGSTIRFRWSGSAFSPVVHNVSIPALGFTSGEPVKTATVDVVFNAPGTYTYICDVHADTMVGTVTVQ